MPPSAWQWGSVLLVCGDAMRQQLSPLLRGAGYALVHTSSAEGALEEARRERPVLVMSEVCLPGMSGYELCRALREELGESLPVMLVSAERIGSTDRTAALVIGADEYAGAPLEPNELLARVRRLVLRTQTGDGNGAGPELTRREDEILRLLARGSARDEIARELVISRKTVSTHIQHILDKLGAHSRAEAVAIAYRTHLVSPDDSAL